MNFEKREPQYINVDGASAVISAYRHECALQPDAAQREIAFVAQRSANNQNVQSLLNTPVEFGPRPHALPRCSEPMTTPQMAASLLRTASQTRVLALALQRNPFPSFTKKCVETRWQVGPDSVRKILRNQGVDPGSEKSLGIPLIDLLLCEGFSDPLAMWISASPELRKILSADLMTLEDWLAQASEETKRDKTKYYRDLAEGRLASVRIGKQHRFRPTLQAALHWHALRRETQS